MFSPSIPQEEPTSASNSLILSTFSQTLLNDSPKNASFFYETHEKLLLAAFPEKSHSLENLLFSLLSKQKPCETACILDFFAFFGESLRKSPEILRKLWELAIKSEKSLLKAVCSAFSQDLELHFPGFLLIEAAKLGDFMFFEQILQAPKLILADFNVNQQLFAGKGHTFLTWATINGKLRILKLLKLRFFKEIDVNCTGFRGENCLIIAARKGFRGILSWFLENFAETCDINRKDRNEDTAFLKALNAGHYEICEILLQFSKEMQVFYTKTSGVSSLESLVLSDFVEKFAFAIKVVKYRETVQNTVKSAKMLEKSLVLAVSRGNIAILRVLLENQAFFDIFHADDFGRTVLHHAVVSKNREILRFLVETVPKTLDLWQKPDNFAETPLSLAIKTNNFDKCFFLINRLPIFFEISEFRDNLLSKLLRKLSQKGRPPHWEQITEILSKNSSFSLKTLENSRKDGNSLLHDLAKSGETNVFRYLHANFQETLESLVNLENLDLETPLTLCAKCGNWELFEILLEIPKINVFQCDSSKNSFLFHALLNADEAFSEKLVKKLGKREDFCVEFAFSRLVLSKCWEKAVFLMKSSSFDHNFAISKKKTPLFLAAEDLDPENEAQIASFFEIFDYEHQEVTNSKQILLILLEKSAQILDIFLKKLKFHDLSSADFPEIAENLAKIKEKAQFSSVFPRVLDMLQLTTANSQAIRYFNEELLENLPYKREFLEEWALKAPFRLNLSHSFAENQGICVLEHLIMIQDLESLRVLMDFCEKSRIFVGNPEKLLIKSLETGASVEICELFLEFPWFDYFFVDSEGNSLIFFFGKYGKLQVLKRFMHKVRNKGEFYAKKFVISAIPQAIQQGFCEFLSHLLEISEVDLSWRDENGRSLIFLMIISDVFATFAAFAAFCSKFDEKKLVSLFNEPDNTGQTPFLWLVSKGKFAIIEKFIVFSRKFSPKRVSLVNVWAVDKKHRSALDYFPLTSEKDDKNVEFLRKCGCVESRDKLSENAEIQRVLTNPESTQSSVVDRTVQESMKKLKSRYNLSSSRIQEIKEEILTFFQQFCKKPEEKGILTVNNEKFIEDSERSLQFSCLEAALFSAKRLKYKSFRQTETLTFAEFMSSAHSQLVKMLENRSFVHSSTQITNPELLAIIWTALQDISEFSNEFPLEKQRKLLVFERKATFVKHLFEALRDGACARGQFNKVLEALNYAHCDVRIELTENHKKNGEILDVNWTTVGEAWKLITKKSFQLLKGELREMLGKNVYFWGDFHILERQEIFAAFKTAFIEFFHEFFPYLERKSPSRGDLIVLEDVLGAFHLKNIVDFVSALE